MNIPFVSFGPANASIKQEILTAFEQFFDKGWYILGEQVKQFETDYAAFNGVKHCVGVSNGLDALHLALKALDIQQGDEVLVPSNTYIATLLAVSYTGATPVLVEPDKKSYNIDPARIEAAITPQTKAIMPVHLYGQACEMEAIMYLAEKYNLAVVEDNAQAQGASFNGRKTGSWGQVNGTSFYPGKNLGAYGDAGAVTTDSAVLADKIFSLRNYGSRKKYYNEQIGFNMRLDECQAAFLSVKLKYLEEWTRQRQEVAAWYQEQLAGIGDLVLPYTAQGATHVYHLYVVRTRRRDELQTWLNGKGIGTLIHYPVPPHLQEAYKHLEFRKGDFPIAEEIAETCISLPLWPGMKESDVTYIGEAIKSFFLMPRLSIIIPCYYNEENVPVTSRRLLENEQNFPGDVQFEYVMIDDGSKDMTYERLQEFYQEWPGKVKVIKLAGNVGSYNAILAGMQHTTGDCCTVISCDLQDPPELIVKMYDYWVKGNKLVIANRLDRQDGFLSSLLSNFFHSLTRNFALSKLPKGGFDFVLFDRVLKEEVVKMKEKNTNTLFLLLWLGYDYVSIPYVRAKRELGKSKWTFSKKLKLFIDSFVAFSFFPIRFISVIGLILGAISLFYGFYILYAKFIGKIEVQGWTSMMIVFLFISSFQMVALGIIGEYVWRTLDASRNRPLFMIDKVLSGESIVSTTTIVRNNLP